MRFLSFLLVMVALCCALPSRAQSLAAPPFVRKWTQPVDAGTSVIAVRNGTLYYQSWKEVGALDIATGEKKWSSLAGLKVGGMCLHEGTIYALVGGKQLYAVDMATGSSRLLSRAPEGTRSLSQDREQFYVLDKQDALHALSLRTGQTLWSTPLLSVPRPKDESVKIALVPTQDGIYVGIEGKEAIGEELGIASESGRVLWRRKASYPALYYPTAIGGDVVTQGGKLRRINVRTGNVVWTAREGISQGTALGNLWLASGWDATQGYDLATGKRLWKSPIAFGDIISSCSDGQNLLIETINVGSTPDHMVQGTYCLSQKGKLLWQADKAFTGTPVYAGQSHIVTYDGSENRFLGYVPGALPRLPATEAGTKALAERLVAQFESMDAAERQQLENLKPYSTRAFLPRYVELATRGIKNLDATLFALCERENTAALLELWKQGGGEAAVRTLKAKGDPAGYIPTFVQTLRPFAQQIREGKVVSGPMLSVIAHSSHPDAVAFLLDALRDPKAPAQWRAAAFEHLAETGGAEGIAEIRAVRSSWSQTGPRKPWFVRLDLEALPKKAIQTDAKGRTWALFSSEILGNSGDLYIVEKKPGGWGVPRFTGVWTANTMRENAPEAFRGIPIAKLVSTEWIKLFPDDPTIQKDTDGDGLTDLVETRLGTDPKKVDTDSDGLIDSVDPCPTVAPRPLGDIEQVLATCLEAYFFDQSSMGPEILFAPGVVPFEFSSNRGYLLWKQRRKRVPRPTQPGGGLDEDGGICFRHLNRQSPPQAQPVTFSSDGQSARVALAAENCGWCGTFSGGEAFFLRKIDGEWFVVDRIVLNFRGEPMKRYYPGEAMW